MTAPNLAGAERPAPAATLDDADVPGRPAAAKRDGPDGSLRSYLTRGAVGSFALKVTATFLGLVTSVVLARLLGAEGYGIYAYALAIVGLLGLPTTSALPLLVTRNVAACQATGNFGLMHGLLRWVSSAAVAVSIGGAALAAIVVWLLADWLPGSVPAPFWLALLLLPLTAVDALRAAVLQGLRHVVLAQMPEAVIRPGVFIAFAAAAWLLLGSGDVDATAAVLLQVGAAAIACVIGFGLLARRLPDQVTAARPAYQRRLWLQSALPLLLVGGIQVINRHADLIMLGAMKGPEAAGIYRAATQGSTLVAFGLMAVTAALAPVIASLHARGELLRLQRAASAAARAALLVSVPVAAVMIGYGSWLLILIFGEQFAPGAPALAILSAGQLVNAAAGSVGFLLTMTGHERDTARGVGVAAVANIVLNALLIPGWGATGAAIATAVSLALWNILLALFVYRRLGIDGTALGLRTGARARQRAS